MKYATYNDWLAFMREGKEPGVRKAVLDSWRSLLDSGRDPFSQPRLAENPVISEIQKNDAIFKLLVKLLENALNTAQNVKTVWLLCGIQGEIVALRSSNQYQLNLVENIGLKPGVCLEERFAGTNAVSMAMKSNQASFCNGPEHFHEKFHSFSGAAAPFFDTDYNHRGYIALFGPFPEIDGELLRVTLLLFIQSLDREMRLNRSKDFSNSLRQLMTVLYQEDLTPTLLVNKSGYLRHLNPAAVKLLELEDSGFDEKNLDKIASFKPSIKEIAKSAIVCQGAAMSIKTSNKLLKVNFEKQPIFSQKDEYLGVLLLLREKSQTPSSKSNEKPVAKYDFEDILGQTPSIMVAKDLAKRVAKTSSNVLLSGPSGSGKEMFAHSIHNSSERKDYPFVAINCAAIPREIAESELFGYASGAFTGANKGGNVGKLMAADKGTVFLDEIGDMPLDLQAKLLRLLEDRTITRIGESKEIPVNIRVIAATNKDILSLIEQNLFREDLYYRLSVTSIHLPSLSDSRDDIPEIVGNFIEYFNETMGKKVKGVNEKIMDSFKSYSWPGNIRELRNAIEFAVMLNSGEDWITWRDLPGQLRMALLYRDPVIESKPKDPLSKARKEVENSEKLLYQKAIRMANGNLSKAAQILKIGRSTLYRKIKKYELQQ